MKSAEKIGVAIRDSGTPAQYRMHEILLSMSTIGTTDDGW